MNYEPRRNMDYKQTSQKITEWILERVSGSGFSDVVIGLSGGIDSALSATLAVQALGKEHVFPVLMPYGNLQVEAVEDAKLVIDSLKIPEKNVSVIDITQAVNVFTDKLENQNSKSETILKNKNIRQGNIMARVRMIYLFDLAKKQSALVLGTENKTEHYLGYFTRFGDEASDIEPIRSLYKTQVWEMAKVLHIPEKIIEKAPTAGLWQDQTDEKELGFTYKDADLVLSLHFDNHLSEKEIVRKGIAKDVVKKVLEKVKQNEFKHKLPHKF